MRYVSGVSPFSAGCAQRLGGCITQKVYAPLCGKFLASEASKLGRYLAPSLIREIS
jgi:hypothetical protein